jgi:Lamin Tail Domain/PKD domain
MSHFQRSAQGTCGFVSCGGWSCLYNFSMQTRVASLKKIVGAFLFAFMVLTPSAAFAQVAISEVMYDPAGSDDKHEWIEVCNTSSGAVDLSTFKLLESGSNHGLTAILGGASLASGACAVVADDATTFKADYAGYAGQLFDSSFSLSNSGEVLVIKTGADVVVDTTSYPATTAKGDGNSLHRSGAAYTASAPTPGIEAGFSGTNGTDTGAAGASSGAVDASQVVSTGTTATPATGVTSVINFQTVTVEPPPKLTLRVVAPVGAHERTLSRFGSEVFNTKGQVVKALVRWNYGDGSGDTGGEVRHAYADAGSYLVHVSAIADGLSDSADVAVKVLPLSVTIEALVGGKTVQVENKTTTNLNLTAWKLRAGSQYYVFPDDTFVLPNTAVKFPVAITKLTELPLSKYIELLSPLGERVADARLPVADSVGAAATPVSWNEPLNPFAVLGVSLAGLRHQEVSAVPAPPARVALQTAANIPGVPEQKREAQAVEPEAQSAEVPERPSHQRKRYIEEAPEVVAPVAVSKVATEDTAIPAQAAAAGLTDSISPWYIALALLCIAAAAPFMLATAPAITPVSAVATTATSAEATSFDPVAEAKKYTIIDISNDPNR